MAGTGRTRTRPMSASVAEALGPPAIYPEESADDYAALLEHYRRAVRPEDFIEEMLVQDAVALHWEMLRLRRMKADLMKERSWQGVEAALEARGVPAVESTGLGAGWLQGDEDATREVRDHLGLPDGGHSPIPALTLQANLELFERLDLFIARAESRRNQALREIDRHRDAVARRRMRRAVDIEELPVAPSLAGPGE